MTTLPLTLEPFSESHLEGVTALYNDPAVGWQVLQMPFQSVEIWRNRLAAHDERHVRLVALHGSDVVGQIGLEQYSRIRRSHVGNIGMGVISTRHRQGIGSRLLGAALDVADNWMNLRRVELTVYADNDSAIGLYHKFGFEVEGRLRNYAVRDGMLVDVLSMARLR